MSIRTKYEEELIKIKNQLLIMCGMVESAIEKSIKALITRDFDLSKLIIENDKNIDNLERIIEQDCLKILLMQHPLATDFRDISAILKMITDLERIGDHAQDISEISLQIASDEPIKKFDNLQLMAISAIAMVKDSVHSYINRDLDTATSLDKRDDKVDLLFEKVKDEIIIMIKNDCEKINQVLLLLLIAKYLERVGDHAVNIGEWVEYAIKGDHSNS
ncbi:MAG: phosphate signaling complex protein PhoU [Bacilli bacterium]|nr:phosphate signaling complex protein PhoU [Bacilli bacterium]